MGSSVPMGLLFWTVEDACPYRVCTKIVVIAIFGFASAKIGAEAMGLYCRWRQKLQATSCVRPLTIPSHSLSHGVVCANGLVFPGDHIGSPLQGLYKNRGHCHLLLASAKIGAEAMGLYCRWRQKLQATSCVRPFTNDLHPLPHSPQPTSQSQTVGTGVRSQATGLSKPRTRILTFLQTGWLQPSTPAYNKKTQPKETYS